MKKLLSLFVAIMMIATMLPSFALANGTATVTMESKTVKAGEQVDVIVSLTNCDSINMFNFKNVNVGENLEIVSVTNLLEGTKTVNEWNGTRFTALYEQNTNANGEALKITLKAKEDAAAGDVTVTFDVLIKQWSDAEDDDVTLETAKVPGVITIETETPAPVAKATVTMESKTVKAGEQVDVIVSLTNCDSINMFNFKNVNVGENLEIVSVTNLLEGTKTVNEWNGTRFTALYEQNTNANGEALKITLKAKEDAAAGDVTVTFDVLIKQWSDAEDDDVTLETAKVPGVITIEAGTPIIPVPTYTVTFKAEGAEDIVITKNVGETLAVADFPAVPAKDGYTGAWDVTTDITETKIVNAVYIPATGGSTTGGSTTGGSTTGGSTTGGSTTGGSTTGGSTTGGSTTGEKPSNVQLSYTVSSTSAEVKVTADANSSAIISVTITVNGVSEELTEADENGVYSHLFTGLSRSTTYPVTVVVKNAAGETTETGEFTTRSGVNHGGGGATKLPVLNDGKEETPNVPVVPETPKFDDVKEDAWFNDSIDYVVENGLMNGVSSSTFAPNASLTRAMLVTVLYRAEGEPAVNRSIPFADVDLSAYYGNAVIWAKQNGIVKGIDENNFAPDVNITREQVAAILYRHAIYKGMDAVNLSENLGFVDADEISEYAISAMNWAVGENLIKGYEDNTVRPLNNITRAEMATVLKRFLSK